MVTTGEQVTARDVLDGPAVARGVRAVRRDLRNRLGRHERRRAGGRDRARAGGSVPVPTDQQGVRGRRDDLWLGPTGASQRYTPYVDGPDPLAPPVDLAEALDAIGEDVMAGYSPERAMREFLRRGGRDQAGLDELARRVAERRKELTQRNNLDGTLQQVKELLDRAVLAERKQLARDVDMDEGDRALAQLQLDNLPSSPAAAVNELNGYDWRSSEARAGVREDQGPAGPGGARPALRRHEAGAGERDRRRPGRAERDARRPQRAARRAEAGPGHPGAVRRLHGQARGLLPRAAAHARRAPRRPRAAGRRGAADAELDDAGAARRARRARAAGVRLVGPHERARASSTTTSEPCDPARTGAARSGMDGENGLGLGDGTGVFQDLADLDALAEQLAQSYEGSQLDDLDLEKLARQLGQRRGRRRPHPAAAGEGAARSPARCGAARTASSR